MGESSCVMREFIDFPKLSGLLRVVNHHLALPGIVCRIAVTDSVVIFQPPHFEPVASLTKNGTFLQAATSFLGSSFFLRSSLAKAATSLANAAISPGDRKMRVPT